MAGLYLVGAWLVMHVAGTVLPMFGVPIWLQRSIVHKVAQDPRFALLLEEMGLPG